LLDKPPLGQGGQATVFRVSDESAKLAGEWALKRLQNPKRHDRFVREIASIKRLTDPTTQAAHPHVISIVDHSALNDIDTPDKQYMVMPIAEGGDLSQPGRLGLYTDSIDGVLQVTKQLASALRAAHAANIIHRDIKPQNILFTGNGHELWLSDFGICLLTEEPRLTESPEAMGPRAFMAPELEMGGRLDVTPAADIYSLGKVIFYMLSGGIVLPREELQDSRFKALFNRGQRYGLIELLLRQMICPLSQRIETIDGVMQHLDKIEQWEHTAKLSSLDDATLAALDAIHRNSADAGRIVADNKAARTQEIELQGRIQASVTAWLREELQKLVPFMSSDKIDCEVRDAAVDGLRVQSNHNALHVALNGVELVFSDANDAGGRDHVFQLFLCRHNRNVVTVTSGTRPKLPKAEPAEDLSFAIVPVYRQLLKNRASHLPSQLGYLTQENKIGAMYQRPQHPNAISASRRHDMIREPLGRVMPSFENQFSIHAEFKASEWPKREGALRATIAEAVRSFVAIIKS
jgi:serine/threonine protein kinase